ncbi:MAG: glucosamine-6-phosphate deaminase [bacterium]
MRLLVYPDTQSAGRAAARTVAELLHSGRDVNLGFATGHTMIPVYGELVRLHEEAGLSFKRARTFNLDEYVGLGPGEPDSYYEYMMHRLVDQVDLPPERFFIPDGKAADPHAECERYERLIQEAGGIDLQLLGLGRNGHIGFNEPGSEPDSRTRVVELAEETRRVNEADFRKAKEPPRRAITMGLATIMEARRILMVVTGWEKAPVLKTVLTSPPAKEVPATFLHGHPDVTLIADREALEEYFQQIVASGYEMKVDPPE